MDRAACTSSSWGTARITRPPKPLSEADFDAWARYVQHVRSLAGKAITGKPPAARAAPVAPPPPPVAGPAVPAGKLLVRVSSEVPIDAAPAGLDRSTWLRLKSGRIAPERKLDLHGMTAARGHHAVLTVLTESARNGQRCVEIITGRGSGETGGVLRRELPHWLNLPSLRPLILAVCFPTAGNQGAVRVLLRRTR